MFKGGNGGVMRRAEARNLVLFHLFYTTTVRGPLGQGRQGEIECPLLGMEKGQKKRGRGKWWCCVPVSGFLHSAPCYGMQVKWRGGCGTGQRGGLIRASLMNMKSIASKGLLGVAFLFLIIWQKIHLNQKRSRSCIMMMIWPWNQKQHRRSQ